jgi:putative membrane protein
MSPTSRASGIKKYLALFLKGMAMGAADSVPGVSGGTIAVITRIYDELIYSIRSVDIRAFRLLLTEGVGRAWTYINGTFLLVLGCGILLSLRLSAGVVLSLLENNFEALMAFFIGLVIASSWSLKSECGAWGLPTLGLLFAGMGLTLLVSGLSPYSTEIGYGYLFLCGVVAICAMILPGLSGAFLLLVLGVYDFVLAALVNFELVTIVVFALGCVTGLLAFSRLLSWTLSRYREYSYAFLTGMLVASVSVLWPWQQVDRYRVGSDGESRVLQAHNVWPTDYQLLTGQDPQLLPVIVSFLIGATIITVADKLFRNSVD